MFPSLSARVLQGLLFPFKRLTGQVCVALLKNEFALGQRYHIPLYQETHGFANLGPSVKMSFSIVKPVSPSL